MNKLLSNTTNLIPIIMISIALIICLIIIVIIKKKTSLKQKTSKPLTANSITLVDNYCTETEMKFLEALHKAMPRELIAFPYVGVDNIVLPKNDKNFYNKILSKYVDVCIFYRRTMQPILAIDLFNSNPIKQALKKMDSDVYDALKAVNIPIVEIKLVENYDINILRKNIFDCLPPKIFALIKDKSNNS